VHSSGGRKEKAALVRGSDAAVSRASASAFFTSTPFLVFVLILLMCVITVGFVYLASTPIVKMNQPPVDFVKRAAENVPYAQKHAVRG
jgi:hypothetical protein